MSDWQIEIRNSFGEWLDVRQLEGYELRLRLREPDRLFLDGREIAFEWRVHRDGVLFSRDSRMWERASV